MFGCIIYFVCLGGPSGFGLLAVWLLSCGGGGSFGATANCKGGCGGVPVMIDTTLMYLISPPFLLY